MTELEVKNNMIPCLTKDLSKEYLKERIASLRMCEVCHRGFFKEHECLFHKKEALKQVKVIEYVRVNMYRPIKIEPLKKVIKKCLVCGLDSGRKQCCSILCNIRQNSSWYENGDIIYISIKEAQERLNDRIERKRLRDLQNNASIK